MAALQVHQTHTALVVRQNCDATVSYIVSYHYLSDSKNIPDNDRDRDAMGRVRCFEKWNLF
jgi:hypothetical protein